MPGEFVGKGAAAAECSCGGGDVDGGRQCEQFGQGHA